MTDSNDRLESFGIYKQYRKSHSARVFPPQLHCGPNDAGGKDFSGQLYQAHFKFPTGLLGRICNPPPFRRIANPAGALAWGIQVWAVIENKRRDSTNE